MRAKYKRMISDAIGVYMLTGNEKDKERLEYLQECLKKCTL